MPVVVIAVDVRPGALARPAPLPTWPVDDVAFEVPGEPRPLARPRFSGDNVYNPSAGHIRDWARAAQPHERAACVAPHGPVRIDLTFEFARPQSHRRARGALKDTAPLFHVSTPDVDNLAKLALDAMNGRFYRDDSQVVELTARKVYTDGPARTLVRLRYGFRQ